MKLLIILQFFFCTIFMLPLAAQGPGCPSGMVCDPSKWFWDLNIDHPDYQKMWTVNLFGKSPSIIGAPWEYIDDYNTGNANTFLLDKIAEMQDYRKDQGWVLVDRDFGHVNQGSNYPYFVLYNKWRGLMRLFLYKANPAVNYSRFVISIEHAGDISSAIISHANTLMLAPDKYGTSSDDRMNEIILTDLSIEEETGWGVAQFRPTFDPNLKSYNNSKITFQVSGLIEANIELDGKSSTSEFALGADKSELKGGETKRLDKAKAAFGYIKNAGNYAQKIREKGEKFKKSKYESVKKLGEKLLKLGENNKEIEANFISIMETTGTIGQIASAVIGAVKFFKGIFGKKSKVAAMPTITYSKFTGTLEWENGLESFTIRTPGAKPSNVNEPIFDCPMGLFNLMKTPQLDFVEFDFGFSYKSFKGVKDLEYAVNATAGHSVKSVEFALVGKDFDNQITSKDRELYFSNRASTIHNVMVFKKRLTLADYDEKSGLVEFQTPFVDFKYFKGFATTFPNRLGNVFLRIRAVLEHPNLEDPIIIIRDYAVNTNKGKPDNPLNPRGNYSLPYDIYKEPLVGGFAIPSFLEKSSTIKANEGTPTVPVVFQAEDYITLKEGFTGEKGSHFLATLRQPPYLHYPPATGIEFFQGQCRDTQSNFINNQELRESAALSSQLPLKIPKSNNHQIGFKLYPNPLSNLGNIELDLPEPSSVTIRIMDLSGKVIKEIMSAQELPAGNNQLEFEVEDLSPGMYFCQAQVGKAGLVKKMVIQP